MADCTHENIEFEAGNHVPPFGWEIYPGYYCTDCGEMVDNPEPDPDVAYKEKKEKGL